MDEQEDVHVVHLYLIIAAVENEENTQYNWRIV